jgi:NADH:ubiquinone oxidoreductase subunit F (NADH-binding)
MSARLRLVRDDTWDDNQPSVRDSSLIGAPVEYADGADYPLQSPPRENLQAHISRLGARPVTAGPYGNELLRALERTALTGRGGGHFPVAQKWRAQLSAGGGGIVVANGAESEPLSAKDSALLQLRPHLVLDGLSCAAEAVGAHQVVLWLHDSQYASRYSITQAIAERNAYLPGEPAVRIIAAPAGYLSGESSSIVNALSGGPALPAFRLVPATTKGVGGRPTLIHNVETLARIAMVARDIAADTTLMTVAGDRSRTVVEADSRSLLTDVLRAGGFRSTLNAVLVGGFGGRWLGAHSLRTVHADETSLRRRHASLGAGVLLPVGVGTCGLGRAAEITEYLAASSARQCGPCLFGLRAVADLLSSLVAGQAGRRDIPRLHRFMAEIAGRGACHHPDGAVAMVASALDVFSHDAWSHLRRGTCADV